MGIMKEKYIENQIAKDAEDQMADVPDHAQSARDENRADEIRMLRKEQAQREMYDDPFMNWSGLR
jgi:hypothetical protein